MRTDQVRKREAKSLLQLPPAGAGDVHAVFDEVAARPRSRRWRSASLGSVQSGSRGGAPCSRGRTRSGRRWRVVSGTACDGWACGGSRRRPRSRGPEYLGGLVCDPGLDVGVVFVVERPGRLPHVFEDVHEVADDVSVDAAPVGFGEQSVGLMLKLSRRRARSMCGRGRGVRPRRRPERWSSRRHQGQTRTAIVDGVGLAVGPVWLASPGARMICAGVRGIGAAS